MNCVPLYTCVTTMCHYKIRTVLYKRTLVLYFVDSDLNVGWETKDYFIV